MCDVLERLYLERAVTFAELVSWRMKGSSPYPPRCGAYIHGVQVVRLEYYCGHNPILKAYKVENLSVDGDDLLEWDEIGPLHTRGLCAQIAGVKNCPLAAEGPLVVHRASPRA